MYNYLEIKIFNIIRTKITVGDKLPRCNYYYKFKSRACQSVLPGKIFFNKNIWRLIKTLYNGISSTIKLTQRSWSVPKGKAVVNQWSSNFSKLGKGFQQEGSCFHHSIPFKPKTQELCEDCIPRKINCLFCLEPSPAEQRHQQWREETAHENRKSTGQLRAVPTKGCQEQTC